MQQRFDTRKYSISDFEEWDDKGDLVLAPKFQRRQVWNPKARSYLIDTIIRGKPIPKIFMRQFLDTRSRKTTREVVDGQQRLHTVLTFIKDEFRIDKDHNEDYPNMLFSELEENVQRDILRYEFAVDLLQDMPDSEVYEVFARLNTYSYKLTPQELRHAKFFGAFRTCVYKLANEFMTFWVANKIFSRTSLLRMAEAEFVSDLLIAISVGIQEKSKGVIDHYYDKFDDYFTHRLMYEKRFRLTIDHIGGIFDADLPRTHFKTTRLFFPLFCAIYHAEFGVPGITAIRKSITPSAYPHIQNALLRIEEIFRKVKAEGVTNDLAYLTVEQRRFYKAYSEYWVRAANRKFLTQYICRVISQPIKKQPH